MRWMDFHCDTLSKIVKEEKIGSLTENDHAVDLHKIFKSGGIFQVFASWLNFRDYPEKGREEAAWEAALSMNRRYQEEASFYENTSSGSISAGKLVTLYSSEDFSPSALDGRIHALLSIEEGGILDSRPERLDTLYDLGIRLITLTWNYENCIGFPNSKDPLIMERGLKPFGKQLVEAMQEKHMLVDVSHLSDGGFYDVADIMDGPFLASHSNARAICPHPRNLTDEMLGILGEHGGVTGLNLYPYFLHEGSSDSRIEDMLKHIDYIIDHAGSEALVLGCDLDGIDGNLEIAGADEIPKLEQALRAHGYTEDLIEKLFWKNGTRFIRDTM